MGNMLILNNYLGVLVFRTYVEYDEKSIINKFLLAYDSF